MQPFYQQPWQPCQMPLSGRAVRCEEEINPNEIPMNGVVSLFPMMDQSVIYAKCWDGSGKLVTTKYIREEEKLNNELGENDSLRLDDLEKRICELEKLLSERDTTNNNSNRKKV